MRALVTGGAGFVGTNVVNRLIEEGYEVIVFDNLSTGKGENIHKESKLFLLDISKEEHFTDKKMDDIMNGVDVIFHLAALARIQPSINSPKETIVNNFNSTLNILECARKYDIPVIYAGSSSKHHGLYGSPYAWSKYGGEELCKLYSEVYGLNTTICRFYNVYGPNHIRTGTYATVIGIFENQYMKKEPLTIVGDGKQRRDFTHIDDIVDGLIKCVGKNHKGDIFELGSGVNYSINEVAHMFNCDKTYIAARPGEYDVTLCDYSQAQKDLDYNPKRNLEEYVTNWIKDLK